MSTFPLRTKSLSPFGSDEFRIEFEGDVLPAPTSRLGTTAPEPDEEHDFEERLARTQEELLQLRHQARVVERRKEGLEEITRKERDYTRGRAEMHEKLSGLMVTLERTSEAAQRQLETLLQARDEVARHYRALSSLTIEDWNAPGVVEQADHALAVINDARCNYERICTRTAACLAGGPQAVLENGPATLPGHGFRYWLLSGFAFTLPLLALGFIALIISFFL